MTWGVQVGVRGRLEFKISPIKRVVGRHLLPLNLKNAGTSILKNMVVRLQSLDSGFSVVGFGCFVYALMPSAEKSVNFRVFGSSKARVYFSVSGYASGDQHFSVESPIMEIPIRDAAEHDMLLT
jgi:hypothetical protein